MTIKGATFKTDILKLIFNGTTIPNLADNTVVSPVTTLYVALHLEDPLGSNDQTTNEVNYPNYIRVGVPRNSSNWTVTSEGKVYPNAEIVFPPVGAGTSGYIRFWSVGTASSGSGYLLYSGALPDAYPYLSMAAGDTLILTTDSYIQEK